MLSLLKLQKEDFTDQFVMDNLGVDLGSADETAGQATKEEQLFA
jgi:hypothetical protein